MQVQIDPHGVRSRRASHPGTRNATAPGPRGAAGAVIIGSWLVEAKQSVIENMAPVLTRLFTPLFTLLLLAFLATMAWTGNPINVKREILIGFDLLLAVIVGLVLYAASARDPQAPPDFFDGLHYVMKGASPATAARCSRK